jgi:hypothetical protein
MDGSTYEGELKNKKRNGLGRLKFLDGSVYTGAWANDLP